MNPLAPGGGEGRVRGRRLFVVSRYGFFIFTSSSGPE